MDLPRVEIKRLESCGLCPDRLGRSLNLRHDSDIRYLHYQKLKDRKFIRNHPQCIGRKLMKLFRKYYFGVRLLFLFPKLHTIRPNNVIHSKKVARYRAREEELKDLLIAMEAIRHICIITLRFTLLFWTV